MKGSFIRWQINTCVISWFLIYVCRPYFNYYIQDFCLKKNNKIFNRFLSSWKVLTIFYQTILSNNLYDLFFIIIISFYFQLYNTREHASYVTKKNNNTAHVRSWWLAWHSLRSIRARPKATHKCVQTTLFFGNLKYDKTQWEIFSKDSASQCPMYLLRQAFPVNIIRFHHVFPSRRR